MSLVLLMMFVSVPRRAPWCRVKVVCMTCLSWVGLTLVAVSVGPGMTWIIVELIPGGGWKVFGVMWNRGLILVCVRSTIESCLHLPLFGFVVTWLMILPRSTKRTLATVLVVLSRRKSSGAETPQGRPLISCRWWLVVSVWKLIASVLVLTMASLLAFVVCFGSSGVRLWLTLTVASWLVCVSSGSASVFLLGLTLISRLLGPGLTVSRTWLTMLCLRRKRRLKCPCGRRVGRGATGCLACVVAD